MHKVWAGIAVLFAIAFVLTATIALLFVNLDQALLNAATYKNVLNQQRVYDRMPGVLAEQIIMTLKADPCATNPLKCGNASTEFKDCAKTALGDPR